VIAATVELIFHGVKMSKEMGSADELNLCNGEGAEGSTIQLSNRP